MKGNKKPYFIRIFFAIILFSISLMAFIPNFKPLTHIYKLNFAPALASCIISFSLLTLIVVLINLFVAWFFGRFYCSTLCPFGILQDIIGGIFKRKSGQAKNLSILRYLIFAITVSLIAAGVTAVFRFIDPYSTFGGIISTIVNFNTKTLIGLLPLFIVTALVLWKNRIFCTAICPVGTTLGLCSRVGYNKLKINTGKCKKCGQCSKNCPTGAIDISEQKIDNERCIRCMRCIGFCYFKAVEYGKQEEKLSFDKSRRTFISAGIITAIAVGFFAKGKEVAETIVKKFKTLPICPPGATAPDIFAEKCTSCGLCVAQCKGKVIEKPNSEYETIHLNYEKGHCEFNCKNCSEVCPTGAIQKITLDEKQHLRIAMAAFSLEECIKCGICTKACPKGAIKAGQDGIPVFDASVCIGCGACQNACPMKCIKVVSIKKQSKTA